MSDAKPGPALSEHVLEVQGAMPSDAALEDALSRLTLAGYDRGAFSLPDERSSAGDGLPTESADNPTDETDKAQMRTMGGGMAGYAGAVAVAAATIATGGAAAVAAGAAAVVGGGAALAANAAGKANDRANTAERDRKGGLGELILAVRTTTPAQVDEVSAILREAGAAEVTTIERGEQQLTAGHSSASWTGG